MTNSDYLALSVPFDEKDQAKELFARWDSQHKTWYATNRKYYYRFKKWISGDIIVIDYLGIAQGEITCWKCGKKTRVSAPAITAQNTIDFDNGGTIADLSGFDVYSFTWEVANTIMPKQLIEYGKQNYSIKVVFSKTEGHAYLGNICEHCNSLQGNFFLHSEPDSPFLYQSTAPLSIERLRLGNGDLILPVNSIDTQISPATNILDRVTFTDSTTTITNYK